MHKLNEDKPFARLFPRASRYVVFMAAVFRRIFGQHFSFISEAVTHAMYPPLKDLRTIHSFTNNQRNALVYTTMFLSP